MKFQFVSGRATKAEYFAKVEDIPFKQTGVCESVSVRAELRGQPVFDGFCGPMWGGYMDDEGNHKFDGTGELTIRYESWESYEALSR